MTNNLALTINLSMLLIITGAYWSTRDLHWKGTQSKNQNYCHEWMHSFKKKRSLYKIKIHRVLALWAYGVRLTHTDQWYSRKCTVLSVHQTQKELQTHSKIRNGWLLWMGHKSMNFLQRDKHDHYHYSKFLCLTTALLQQSQDFSLIM